MSNPSYLSAYRAKFKDRLKKSRNRSRLALRKAVLKKYGGRCICCRERIYEFLHVVDVGTLNRANYAALAKSDISSSFCIYCSNCWLARKNDKYCPHQQNAV